MATALDKDRLAEKLRETEQQHIELLSFSIDELIDY